jgi:hypothetical protein
MLLIRDGRIKVSILLETDHARLQERASGGYFQRLPLWPDTDGDGVPDSFDNFINVANGP